MISKSFRYYKAFGDFMRDFDRGLSKKQYCFVVFCFKIIETLRLSLILKIFFERKIIKKKIPESDIVSFVYSGNHKTIYNQLYKLGIMYPVYDFSGRGIPEHKSSVFSASLIFIAAIINIRRTVNELEAAKDDSLLFTNSVRIIKLCGEEFIYNNLLKDVKVIIKYNDHGPDVVLLSDMAEERNIKTVYIQHAPVNEEFPPLYHDLNVLFSEDSVDKYRLANETVKKFILFDVRFVDRKLKAIEPENNTILICTNDQDDIEAIKNLSLKLGSKFKIVVRPHPGDRRNWKGEYHLSTNKSVWDDLELAKYVLANESGVLLEGIYSDRLCYKCAFFSPSFDNYGFLKKRLILKEYESEDALIEDINNNVIVSNKQILPYFIGQANQKDEKINELKNEILALRNQI